MRRDGLADDSKTGERDQRVADTYSKIGSICFLQCKTCSAASEMELQSQSDPSFPACGFLFFVVLRFSLLERIASLAAVSNS